jgi:hypothetical protein
MSIVNGWIVISDLLSILNGFIVVTMEPAPVQVFPVCEAYCMHAAGAVVKGLPEGVFFRERVEQEARSGNIILDCILCRSLHRCWRLSLLNSSNSPEE